MFFAALIKATFEIPKWNDLDLRIFSFQNWAFWNPLLGFTLTTRFRCGRRFQQTLTANKLRKVKSMWTKACCVYGGDDWSHHISGWIGFGDLGAFWSFWIWWNHQDFKNKPFFWRLEDPASLQNHLCFGSRGSSWKTPSLSTCFFRLGFVVFQNNMHTQGIYDHRFDRFITWIFANAPWYVSWMGVTGSWSNDEDQMRKVVSG